MTPDHVEMIRQAISPLDTENIRETYRRRDFPRADAVKDLDKRYRWDLYYAAVRRGASLPDSTTGYTMAHIDTALRSIVAPLESDRIDYAAQAAQIQKGA
jgi:hypothetical protein